MQSSIFIPLFSKESNQNGYLANNSYIWQNRFFYDYSFPGSKFQLFSELGLDYSLEKKNKTRRLINGGYANSSVELAPNISQLFSKFKIYNFGFAQQLIEIDNKFSQNYTALGLGAKYQLSESLNIETLYSKLEVTTAV
jgi:hypothetical protein